MVTLRAQVAAAAACTALVVAGSVVLGADAQAATAACGGRSLTVTRSTIDGAGGHGGVVLLFRNSSGHSCSLTGYPGLNETKASGRVIARAKRTVSGYFGGAGKVRTILLKPNAFASAIAEWVNVSPVDGHNCTQGAYLRVTPANTSHTVRIPTQATTNCYLEVHPTAGGASGDLDFARAQQAWMNGGKASFPGYGGYWQRARSLLMRSKFSGDDDAANVLKQLLLLPDANRTTKQNAQYRADIRYEDSFFTTPRLYT